MVICRMWRAVALIATRCACPVEQIRTWTRPSMVRMAVWAEQAAVAGATATRRPFLLGSGETLILSECQKAIGIWISLKAAAFYSKVHEALTDALATHFAGDVARLLQSHCQTAHHHTATNAGELCSSARGRQNPDRLGLISGWKRVQTRGLGLGHLHRQWYRERSQSGWVRSGTRRGASELPESRKY